MLNRRNAITLGLASGLARMSMADEEVVTSENSPFDPTILPDPTVSNWRFGLKLSTPVTCTDVVATFAVPRDWPEQTVEIVSQKLDAPLQAEVRDLPHDCARQVIVTAPRIAAGVNVDAYVEMKITRHNIGLPTNIDGLVIPQRLDRDLRMFTGNSPNIDASHGLIRKASRELEEKAPDSAWKKVEAIYDFVREKVKYVEGPIRNASDALKDGQGDCEDMTSLFVAMCRNAKVPARMVWIPGHCYPEFLLFDPDGGTHWYPCQAAGSRAFGEMPEERPILQKGDKFRVPEKTSQVRYLAETFRCEKRGKGSPRPNFVMEPAT